MLYHTFFLPLLLSAAPAVAAQAGDVGEGGAKDLASLPTGKDAGFRQHGAEHAAPAGASAFPPPLTGHDGTGHDGTGRHETGRHETGLGAGHPWPVPAMRLSSGYGERRDPMNGARRPHFGIDIAGPAGTPVLASAHGTVRFAGSAGSYGKMVEIDHGGGMTTRYAHLSRIDVAAGQTVLRSQAIAAIGSTGRSTGPHLHFELRDEGRPRDPLAYMDGIAMGDMAERPLPATLQGWRPLPATLQGWRPLPATTPHISRFARIRDTANIAIEAGTAQRSAHPPVTEPVL